MLKGKHILVGISGGIAAYKIPELIRLLVKAGAEVRVATTKNALEFVTELTLQTVSGSRVYSDVFAAINEHSTEHISLPDWCDAMIVAPATANVIGKMAAGIADDALTTTICSCTARKPIVVAPAMNDKMWESPATRHAIETIKSWNSVTVIEPACGPLACGTEGKGRMPEVEVLQEALEYALAKKDLTGRHILITAGGTREAIDPVRFVSNYSTGKMGFALAQACARRGADVTLVCGAVSTTLVNPLGFIRRIDAISAQSMFETCQAEWPKADTAILCAAVADFTPAEQANEKIKKQPGQTEMSLRMVLTPDIARSLGESKKDGQRLIGFALETHDEKKNALLKLERKRMDAIVLNSLRDKGAGFGTDTNRVTILSADGNSVELPLQSKADIADKIIEAVII